MSEFIGEIEAAIARALRTAKTVVINPGPNGRPGSFFHGTSAAGMLWVRCPNNKSVTELAEPHYREYYPDGRVFVAQWEE